MKFTVAAAASALLLASQASALPTKAEKRDIPSSYYQEQEVNGSIYSFSDDASCNQVFYTAGSCGLSTYFTSTVPSSSGVNLVAMPSSIMSQFGSSQNNQLCGKTIQITGPNGVVKNAIIADTNVGGDNSIDMCEGLWTAFGHQANDGSIFTGANSLKWELTK